jgi:hypothetical protein
MKNSDSLFVLIKSLTRNEKGYFKKFVSKYSDVEGRRYVQLFNMIDIQKEYDEDKIKKKITNDKEELDLSVLKNYLYQAVLKSLRSYHSELSIDSKLQNMLKDAEILYAKSLYADAEAILKKALTQAKRYQRHTVLLDIYFQLYRLIMVTEKSREEYEKHIDQYFNEQLEILEAYAQITHYRMLRARVMYLPSLREKDNSEKENVELSKILQSPFLQDNAQFLSNKAGYSYHWILGVLNTFTLNNQTAAYNYNNIYVKSLEKDPLFLNEEMVPYIGALNNLLINLVRLQKYEEFESTIKKLRMIPIKFPVYKVRIMELEWNIGLLNYIVSGQIDKGLQFLENNESDFLKHEDGMSKSMRIGIYDSISILYFVAGNYSVALKWANKIILSDWNVRPDVTCFSHLLALIIQFEKKNYELIDHTYKHTYRFITNHMGKGGLEYILLNFIKKAIFLSDKELLHHFEELQQDMLHHSPKNDHPNFFELFDPFIWVESKLNRVSMKELYVNKLHK